MWDQSAAAWIESLETDATRNGLLDPIVERLLAGELAANGGMRLLDVGCGEGRFCRKMQALGASTVGVDPTEALVAHARKLDPLGEYHVSAAEDLSLDSRFDAVLFYLSLVDISDIGAALAAAARHLRPGGLVVAADLSSFATCRPNPWVKDEDGRRLFVPVENYAGERPMEVAWKGIRIINYHRSLEVMLGAFLKQGLVLEAYLEPQPTPEAAAAWPSLADEIGVPLFFVSAWRKPG